MENTAMGYRRTIASEGLLLVSVPLAFEILFMSIIVFLLSQAQSEVARFSRSREIIARTNQVERLMVHQSTAASYYFVMNDPAFKAKSDDMAARILEEYRLLKTLAADTPPQLEKVKSIEASTKLFFKRMHELTPTSPRTDGLSLQTVFLMPNFKELNTESSRIGKALRQLTLDEQQTKNQSRLVREATRKRVEMTLIGGLILNLILSIVLALKFSNSVRARLSVIIENTARLPKRLPLLPPIAGEDEIADVDAVFHTAAADLAEFERFRTMLISVLADELGAPLQTVHKVIGEFLSGDLGEISEKSRDRLDIAQESSERLMRLVGELLDLECLEHGRLELVLEDQPVSAMLFTATAAVQELVEKSHIRLVVDETQASVYGDSDRLVQVLINLLSNAIKYSPEAGAVTVHVGQKDNQVEISITDEGRGIPEELQSKIFEKYEQVEASDATEKGGSGLGLTIVRSIVERHGGSIVVKSAPSKGSTFTITLQSSASSSLIPAGGDSGQP